MSRLLVIIALLVLLVGAESVLAQSFIPQRCSTAPKQGFLSVGTVVNMKIVGPQGWYRDDVTIVCYPDWVPNTYFVDDGVFVYIVAYDTLTAEKIKAQLLP